MSSSLSERPNILVLAGLDPSGGAGLVVDIQTISALEGHCLPICTSITMQNGEDFSGQEPVNANIIKQQLDCLMNNHAIDTIKIGALGSVENINIIGEFISGSHVPVVLDPILVSSSGGILCSNEMLLALKSQLIPHCSLCTPNLPELLLITGSLNQDKAIEAWFSSALKSCDLLITGGHSDPGTSYITNVITSTLNKKHEWQLERINGEFRGTGCTLSSAIATSLAKRLSSKAADNPWKLTLDAISDAQEFLSCTLQSAYRNGHHSVHPNRVKHS